MKSNSPFKVFISILCVCALAASAVLIYAQDKKIKDLENNIINIQTEFDNYKISSVEEIKIAEQKYTDVLKTTNFDELEYEYGDLAYGSLGVANSTTYSDMVVDWRPDPVFINTEKTAYLTFDDGPTERTEEILDILDSYNVKATFFVLGHNTNLELCKDIIDRGHALGLHTQTHVYDNIYPSLDAFLDDYYKLFQQMVEITGEVPVLFRFPGGSNNTYAKKYGTIDEIKEEMYNRGFIYHDWNVSGEDAVYANTSADFIAESVLNGAKDKTTAVVLLHDSTPKHTTVEALPEIIEGLNEQGFKLDKLTPEIKPIQFK